MDYVQHKKKVISKACWDLCIATGITKEELGEMNLIKGGGD